MTAFLANENFPVPSIAALRNAGLDVTAITEDSPGIADTIVLAQATQEKRIILTFDRDYGELIFYRKLPVPLGVIYLRFVPATPTEAAERILALLNMDHITLEGMFTIIGETQIRQRALP